MGDSVNIRISRELFEALDEDKRDDETWTERIERARDADDARNLHASEPLTRDDVPDLADELARKTADEVENRLSRR